MSRVKMKLFCCLLLACMAAYSHQLNCSDDYRRPDYSDISVECGTSSITLAILMCPVNYTGYDETNLVLNHNYSNPYCRGTLDDSVVPPVVTFSFPINIINSCGSLFRTTSAPGTEVFAGFSNIQTVNISGVVRSDDPTSGVVTYNAELKYFYSCAYPLEYLVNNNQMAVSSASIAVTNINGSFISTLSMDLFSDINFQKPLIIPELGLELRTTIYVQVHASNLTPQYNVFLDRCYASISPYLTSSTFYDLFVSCDEAEGTSILENGDSNNGRFSFEAFGFIEQKDQMVSTYYIQCITRLCEISTCNDFKCNRRRRRDVSSAGALEGTTLTSKVPIVIKNHNAASYTQTPKEEDVSSTESSESHVTGLAVATGVLAVLTLAAGAVTAVLYRRLTDY